MMTQELLIQIQIVDCERLAELCKSNPKMAQEFLDRAKKLREFAKRGKGN